MFEKRPFLLGLGAGLIAGALLLQLMIAGQEQSAELDRIDQLNGEDRLYTQTELDERVARAEDRIRQELEQSKPTREAADDSGTAAGDAAAGDAEDEPAAGNGGAGAVDWSENGKEAAPGAQPAKMTVDKLPVRIKPGMTLAEVAALLKSKGVIEDEKLLLAMMSDISGEIEAGFYFFDGELSPADVKAIITSPPFAY